MTYPGQQPPQDGSGNFPSQGGPLGYPQGAQPGYPQGVQPGYPQGAQPGYPQGAQPGYPQGAQPGYAQQPGYPQGVQPGYPQGAYTPAQSGPTSTIWVWISLALQALSIVPLFLFPWNTYIEVMLAPATSSPGVIADALPGLVGAYIGIFVAGLAIRAADIVCAFLDWRELKRRGVDRPFHWAFDFINPIVYGIGRGVVLRSRGRQWKPPFWTLIAVQGGALIAGTIFAVWLVTEMLNQVSDLI